MNMLVCVLLVTDAELCTGCWWAADKARWVCWVCWPGKFCI